MTELARAGPRVYVRRARGESYPLKPSKPARGNRPGEKKKTARKQRTGLSLRRWARRLLAVAGGLAALPLALTIAYLPAFVHPVSTLMLADLVTLKGYSRQWVDIDDVSPVLLHSIIMSEDGQFCRHRGIDFGELNAVIGGALEGEPVRGASTISMQTVKNLFLWPGRSLLRKAIEAPLALYFDLVLPKKRIMEIYINIVELGPRIYGVEAAAQYHFGVSSAKLSRRQAALLAVTLPNPAARNPARPGKGMSRVASVVERRARAAGAYVTCIE